MNKRLEEILQRKEEIRSLLSDEKNKNLNFDELEKEVRDLTKKKKKFADVKQLLMVWVQ